MLSGDADLHSSSDRGGKKRKRDNEDEVGRKMASMKQQHSVSAMSHGTTQSLSLQSFLLLEKKAIDVIIDYVFRMVVNSGIIFGL